MRRTLACVMRLSPEYHIERDYLTACVLRISAGFCPTENLRAAQEHLDKIQKLINEVKLTNSLKKQEGNVIV